ncbi:hypothetical protein [Saccharopolyspora sp. CA-218241]|uniref:hypothetical protein n=1 Tax=Saccharopolyspora sp. CA-218241 TaxID=3240027 RepID=UPI003D98094C
MQRAPHQHRPLGASASGCGPTIRAVQSAARSSPASTTSGGLQLDAEPSRPHTRTRTSRLSRESNGETGHGTRTDSSLSTRPPVAGSASAARTSIS